MKILDFIFIYYKTRDKSANFIQVTVTLTWHQVLVRQMPLDLSFLEVLPLKDDN